MLEGAEYRAVLSDLLPVMRQVGHVSESHPFFVDDGTGRVLVDPSRAHVDALVLRADEGLLVERRLRAGEDVEVVSDFELKPTSVDGGPYRADSMLWTAVDDGANAPTRVALSSEHLSTGLTVPDDSVTLLRGLGAMLVLASVAFAGVGLLATQHTPHIPLAKFAAPPAVKHMSRPPL